ncbi:MAG: hypothetical protein ACLFQM_05495 [Fidelibacterota bacterium]
MSINPFILLTIIITLISYFADPQKTRQALSLSIKKIKKIFPTFMWMLILMAVVLYFISEEEIRKFLSNDNMYYSLILALSTGSVAMLPGFIAFPLCGILLDQGVSYMILSGFTSTLMMVGIVTFPVEVEYIGVKLGIVRNLLSLIIAVIVALVTGLVFGELF